MKSTIGEHIKLSLFGESHGDAIGIVINGLPPGIALDLDFIHTHMEKRKAKGRISTQRHEDDKVEIISGFFNGYTTGTPLTIMIVNTAQKSQDYEKTKDRLRPSHADFTADEKYLGYQDYRGGGHFSGRITAPLVAAGAIAIQILKTKNILIGTHIHSCHGIHDISFSDFEKELELQLHHLDTATFPTLDENIGIRMQQDIEKVANEGDSVGGILESVILHMPTGIGEPYFHSLESVISHYLYSIPAVKAVSFGLGFGFADILGSQANDSLCVEQERVITKTNHNGGINGGISNGMPIKLSVCIKPTPSIYKEQETIHKVTHEAEKLHIQGRHDPAIIHRARIVVDSMIALAILDLYMEQATTLSMK